MSSKNSFDGIQFRIMETLEKAKGVPLTAREIAERLHADEYRDAMFDTINYKVTNSCHAMKEKGKIVITDARDRDGRLTYQLPKRMIFPRVEDAPAKAPVLPIDIAQKIVPAEPKDPEPEKKPEKRKPGPRGAHAVRGVNDTIIAVIDKAPYPLASSEILPLVEHTWDADQDKAQLLASALSGLTKDKRVFIQPSTKRVRGAKYEYFTRKTGRPAPAETVKKVPTPVKVEKAPLPSQAPKPQPAPSAVKPLFRPGQAKEETRQLNITVPAVKYQQIVEAAERFNVPIVRFVLDAVDFAMSYTGDE